MGTLFVISVVTLVIVMIYSALAEKARIEKEFEEKKKQWEKDYEDAQTCPRCKKFPAFNLIREDKTKSTTNKMVKKKRYIPPGGRKDWSSSDIEPDEYEETTIVMVEIISTLKCINCGFEKKTKHDREYHGWPEDDDLYYQDTSSKIFK